MGIRGAATRAVNLVSRRFALFVTPIAVAGLGFRGLLWVLHKVLHGEVRWLDLILFVCVCFPLEFYAEGVVSALYLRILGGQETNIRDGFEVARYPSATAYIARLSAMCFVWLVPAVVVGETLALLLKAILKAFWPQTDVAGRLFGTGHWWIVIWLVVYAAWISRYSFVVPMLALQRRGDGSVFRSAVRQTKGYWAVLAGLAVAECLIVHFLDKVIVWPGARHGLRESAVVASVLFTAAMSAYAAGFKTELSLAADSAVRVSLEPAQLPAI